MPTAPPTHRPFGQAVAPATDRLRGSAASRGYDRRWRAFRRTFLQEHPLCADCEMQRRVTAAEDVHHLRKVRDRPDLRLDPANCRALCHGCHAERTARGE